MKQKSLTVNAIMNMINKVSEVLFPLITFPYISRILQPEGLGKISFAQAIATYFVMLGSLGIGLYGTRAVARVRDDKHKLSQLVAELFSLNSIMTIIAFSAFGIFMAVSQKAAEDPVLFWLCSLPMLLAPIGCGYVFGGLEEFTFVALRTIAFRVLTLIAIFAFIHEPSDFRIYVLIIGLNAAGANLINLFYVRKHLAFQKMDWRRLAVVRHLRPISILALTGMAYMVYGVTDKVMLGYMSTMEEVGYYVVSQKMLLITVGLIASFVGVLTPRASYLIEAGDLDKHAEMTGLSFSLLMTMATLCMGGMILCAKPAVLIFSGTDYLRAISMLKVSGGCVLAITLYHFLLYQVAYPMGKDWIVSISLIMGVVSNILFNMFLIPRYHGLGASWATLLSQLVVGTCVWVALSRGNNVIVRPVFIKWIKHITIGTCVLFFVKTLDHVNVSGVFVLSLLKFSLFVMLFLAILVGCREQGVTWLLKLVMRKH